MKLALENVDLLSSTGPNSFAKKLIPKLESMGCSVVPISEAEVSLCFIESYKNLTCPRALRLDGIYFNTDQDYNLLNKNIKRTYEESSGIIFQSNFNKTLISKYFGEKEQSTVIHNGADIEKIESTVPMSTGKYNNIWSCASSWRPHKRLKENIRYFLEHKQSGDLLIIAGKVKEEEKIKDPSVVYFGNLNQNQLYSLYKASSNFIHLAWLDHCPNVVVDARASGCHIICSSTGGTKEIAGPGATIIEEEEWSYEPIKLYDPPRLEFDKKVKNNFASCYDIKSVAKLYKSFLEEVRDNYRRAYEIGKI